MVCNRLILDHFINFAAHNGADGKFNPLDHSCLQGRINVPRRKRRRIAAKGSEHINKNRYLRDPKLQPLKIRQGFNRLILGPDRAEPFIKQADYTHSLLVAKILEDLLVDIAVIELIEMVVILKQERHPIDGKPGFK